MPNTSDTQEGEGASETKAIPVSGQRFLAKRSEAQAVAP